MTETGNTFGHSGHMTEELLKDLDTRFTYHPPKEGQPEKYEQIREEARLLAVSIGHKCPPSRERSLAFTKLEEAVMWANAAIARQEIIEE